MSQIDLRFIYSAFVAAGRLVNNKGHIINQPEASIFRGAKGGIELQVLHRSKTYTLKTVDPGVWCIYFNRTIFNHVNAGQATLAAFLLQTPDGDTFNHDEVQIDGRYNDIDAQAVLNLGEDARLKKCTADIQQTHLVLFVFRFIFLFKLVRLTSKSLSKGCIELPTAVVLPFRVGPGGVDAVQQDVEVETNIEVGTNVEVETNDEQSKEHVGKKSTAPAQTLLEEWWTLGGKGDIEGLAQASTVGAPKLDNTTVHCASETRSDPRLGRKSARTRSSHATTMTTLCPLRCLPSAKTPTTLGVPTRTSSWTKPRNSKRSRTV